MLVEDVLVHEIRRLEELRTRYTPELAWLFDPDMSCTKPAQLTETWCQPACSLSVRIRPTSHNPRRHAVLRLLRRVPSRSEFSRR